MEFASVLQNKALTDKIVSYLYKMVLIPKFCYKSRGLSISMNEADDMEKLIRKLLKAKFSLPRSIINSVLCSPAGYSIPKLLDKIDEQEITNWMIWLNTSGLVGDVTRLFYCIIQEHLMTLSFPGEKPCRPTSRLTTNKYLHLFDRLDARQLNIRTRNPDYQLVQRFKPGTTRYFMISYLRTSGKRPAKAS
jgi:hypothetical protein